MKKISVTLMIFFLLISGCSNKQIYETSFLAFDTLVELKLYDGGSKEILRALKEETLRLEKIFNIHSGESEISVLRDKASARGELAELLALADEMKSLTQGTFDPYLRKISALWAFGTPDAKVPSKEDIERLLREKGEEIEEIDLGGIAKGYAANILQTMAKEKGVKSALFNLGGNIITLGDYQGEAFRIGLQDPLNKTGEILGVIKMKENSAVTSGAYQRGFNVNNVRYHHILNPQTGYPAEGDLLSVTLVMPDSAQADAYSTALFVMGYSRAKEYALKHNLPVILVRADKSVTLIHGENFTLELRNEAYRLLEEQ